MNRLGHPITEAIWNVGSKITIAVMALCGLIVGCGMIYSLVVIGFFHEMIGPPTLLFGGMIGLLGGMIILASLGAIRWLGGGELI